MTLSIWSMPLSVKKRTRVSSRPPSITDTVPVSSDHGCIPVSYVKDQALGSGKLFNVGFRRELKRFEEDIVVILDNPRLLERTTEALYQFPCFK